MKLLRGDIVYVANSYNYSRGEGSGRPAIIVSNNKCNEFSDYVEVVYLTSQPKNSQPTHVSIVCKTLSTALCESIYTIGKDRVGDFIRAASDKEMEEIDQALCVSLGIEIDDYSEEMSDEDYSYDNEELEFKMALMEKERDMYKEMYDSLLAKVVR